MCAFSSGVDALEQNWGGHVNWVNAPFGLVGKVLALVRKQRAVAAIVIPRGWKGSRHWWQKELQENCEGVVWRWNLNPEDARCEPVNKEVSPQPRRYGLSVVFVDFRRASNEQEKWKGRPAEVIQQAWVGAGGPVDRWRYQRVDGGWEEGLPCVVDAHVRH